MNSSDWTFNFFGEYDVAKAKELVLSHSQEDWNKYRWRQVEQKKSAHMQSYQIPIIYDPDYDHAVGKKTEHFPKWKEELRHIEETLQKNIGPGKILRFILVNLPAGKEVGPHRDGITHETRESLKIARRIQIPIFSNQKVFLKVKDQEIISQEGAIVELNQYQHIHSVRNEGDTDRIVIILDYVDFPKKQLLF